MASYDYSGFVSTFLTPGRAGTAGQKIFSIHNGAATGAPAVVSVTSVTVGMFMTVAKAITVAPPIVRLWKVTVLPTGGTAVTKVAADTSTDGTDSAVTILQDASADTSSSAGALTATLPAGTFIKSFPAMRYSSLAFDQDATKIEFNLGKPMKLRNNEGLVVFLDYTNAASNPTTDMWTVQCEFTRSIASGVLL